MDDRKVVDYGTLREAAELLRIAKKAVRRAQEESRRLGVANVYVLNGRLFYELPTGELTTVDPNQRRSS